jgi:hypothetical protein
MNFGRDSSTDALEIERRENAVMNLNLETRLFLRNKNA